MGMTSITLKQEVKDTLADEKPEDMSWSDYLESVAIGGVGDLEAFGGEVPDDNFGQVLDATKDDIEELKELVDRVPDRTADQLEARFR